MGETVTNIPVTYPNTQTGNDPRPPQQPNPAVVPPGTTVNPMPEAPKK